jgi:hypothetical protein
MPHHGRLRGVGRPYSRLLAVTTGRRLRIHWPGLEAVVLSNTFFDWTFNYETLGISRADMAWVEFNPVLTSSQLGFIRSAVPTASSEDVVFFNSLNHDTYWKHGALLEEVQSGPRVIFFHGNRGLNPEILARFKCNHGEFGREFNNGWFSGTSSTTGCYRCIWRTLLTESRKAFDTSTTTNQTTTLGEILHKLNDSAVCRIGYAFRIDDSVTSAPLPLNLHTCLIDLALTMCTALQKKYFMFSTNSLAASLEVSRILTDEFDEVFATSEHALERHVNVMAFS